jgi:DNA-directed RNA polymerase specialized sigma24 family protein
VNIQNKTDVLETFFDFLGPDRTQAGEKYEALRQILMKFFEWRGALSPDHLTDLTFDRVATKLSQGEEIRNIHGYCQKVAYYIYLEWVNRHHDLKHEPLDGDNGLPSVQPYADQDPLEESRLECQMQCLQQLPGDTRELIQEYFIGEGRDRINRREALAARLGISRSALGNRITRLLSKLRECVEKCLKRKHN